MRIFAKALVLLGQGRRFVPRERALYWPSITQVSHGKKLLQRLDPFKVGQSITLSLSGNTKVILTGGTAGVATSLAQNMKVFVVGVYDRALQSFTTVDRIRVLS